MAIFARYRDPEDEKDLTKCERRVLKLILEGHTGQEVADLLYCSKRTVGYHMLNAYRKLKVHNRVQAMRAAVKLGLIEIDA